MAVLYTNNASTLLTASISDAATSFSVTAGTGSLFPVVSGSDYFYITLVDNAGNYEIVKVTGRSTDTFTITRGQDGTSARAFSVGDKVELRIVRAMLNDLKGERLSLSGGTLTGTLVNSSGTPLSFTALGNGTYNIGAFYVNSSLMSLEAPLASDSAGAAQIPLILTWRGGYGDKGGLKLLGAASAELGGNTILHAGNYSSYAAPASHSHSYLPLSGGTVTGNLTVNGEFFAGSPAFGGFPLAPNLIHNSFMRRVTNGVPDGFSTLGNITIQAVHPYTAAFEGPYVPSAPAGAATNPDLATESSPYWFGVYNKGPRIQRGGMADGWHGYGDGKILKVTGSGIASNYTGAAHCAIFLPKELNNLGANWFFSAFVKIVKGSAFAVGSDAGYIGIGGNGVSKSQSDAGPQGWVRYSGLIGTSQITSIDGLAISMAVLPDANGDIEAYIALPYLANVAYKGTNVDSWGGSVVDKFDRMGFYVNPNSPGDVRINENQVLHAGNYSSYAAPASHTHSYLPLSGGTLTGAINTVGTQTLTNAGYAGIEYYNTAGTWEGYIGTEYNAGHLRYNSRQGTHTWYANSSAIGSWSASALNSLVAIQQNGNQVLHAGNYTNYSPSLSGNYKNISAGGLYSRYSYNEGTYISDATSAYTLSPDYGQTTVAMHTSHGMFGGWATTLTMSGYERYGAYQISGNYNASTPELAIRNYNQGISGWTSWVKLLSSANYTNYTDGRYVLKSGDTMTGTLQFSALSNSIIAQHDGTGYYWRGRIISRNSDINRAVFLGNYNGKAGLFAHTNALDGWAPLYLNTLGSEGGYNVYLPHNATYTMDGGNNTYPILNSGNYTDYFRYNTWNEWLRDNNDDQQFKIYGNTRTVIFRTDGNTNDHGGGGYAYIWYYGSSNDSERRMILNTNGNLWTNSYGWLHDAFAPMSHNHDSRYVYRNYTVNGNIDSDWGESFTTFDPVPSGTPPLSSPNIRTINLGNDYNRRTQLAFNYESDRAFFRRRNEGGWSSWREFLHSGNFSDWAAPASHSHSWPSITSGYRENYELGIRPADNSSSYAGFRFATPGNNENAGYLLIRGGADNDVYTQNGITLVADAGWLTLAQRYTTDKGVRLMTNGTTRLSVNYYGDIAFVNGNSINYNSGRMVYGDSYAGDENYNTGSIGRSGVNIDDIFQRRSGFIDVWAGGGAQPFGGTTHVTGFQSMHYWNGSTGYGLQVVGNHENRSSLKFRLRSSNGINPWYDIIHSGNYTSYSDGRYVLKTGDSMTGRLTISPGWTTTGRNYSNEWIEFSNYTGLYSPNNGAHFYPNDGSYGAWRIQGSRNGWRGITFDGSVTLMMNDNESGFYKDGYGWQFRWNDGTAYVHKSSYGGGTSAAVLDSVNYTNYTLPIGGGWYGSGLPGSRWGGYSVNGGEISFGRDLPNNGQMGILVDGCYVAGENNGFWSLASDNTWGSRRGMYWDGSYLNFTTNTPSARFQGILTDGRANLFDTVVKQYLYVRHIEGKNWDTFDTTASGLYLQYASNGNVYIGSSANIALHAGNFTNYIPYGYPGWPGYPGTDANTFHSGNWLRSSFTYSNNAPYTGTIVHFPSSGYDLQFNGTYSTTGLAFRNRNGDNGTWNAWSTVLHSNNYTNYTDGRYVLKSGDTMTGDLRFNNNGYGRIAYADNYHGVVIRGYPTDAAGSISAADVTSLIQHSGDFRFYRTNGSINELYFQVNSTAPYWRGNTILHAGNSTSYDAYRASGQGGYPHAGWGMFAFYNWGGSNGGASAPSSSSYTVGLSVGSHPSDQNYGFQIARNMWNTGLWTRGYDYGWGSWVRLLDSSNYSEYALPLSGGTMTSWLKFSADVGLRSDTNSAYLYANNASYGAYRIAGSRNGWNGIEFDGSSTQVSLMIEANGNTVGWHANSYGWKFRVDGGTAYVYKSFWGGGTEAVVLDSSNYTNYVTSAPTAFNVIGSVAFLYRSSGGSFSSIAHGGTTPGSVLFYCSSASTGSGYYGFMSNISVSSTSSQVGRTTAFSAYNGSGTYSPIGGTWRALSVVTPSQFDGYNQTTFPGGLYVRIA